MKPVHFFLVMAVNIFGQLPPALDERPNILWVVNEDHSATFATGYGDPLARTPNFDRLARTGILFERAYSTSAVCAPTRASIITGMYATSLGTQHMRSVVSMPAWMRYYPAYLRDAGYFTSNRHKTDYNAEVLPGTWDQNHPSAHFRQRRPGQPFFSIFNFTASHESSVHVRRPLVTDPARVRVPPYLPDTPDVRADLAQYYDSVSEADRQIGEVLAELAADGLTDNTIIFYYSDHGGVLPRSKRYLYENGTRPVLLMHFPPKYQHLAPAQPGTRTTELVNLVDLAPTLLSLTGIPLPDYFQGRAIAGPARRPAPEFTFNFRDRVDERVDMARAVTDGRWRYIRNYRADVPVMQHISFLHRMASMRDWYRLYTEGKLTPLQGSYFQPKAVEELYDCANDPHNIRNLAADPNHAHRIDRFRSALGEHLLKVRDTGFMPEPMLRELAANGPPVEIGRDNAHYPLARIIAVIDSLQLQRPSPETIRAYLNDRTPMLRYWAAITAQNRSDELTTELATLLTDVSGSVRLAAANALARRPNPPEATWQVFISALSAEQTPELRLEALNWLQNLPLIPAHVHSAIDACRTIETPAPYGAYLVGTIAEINRTHARQPEAPTSDSHQRAVDPQRNPPGSQL